MGRWVTAAQGWAANGAKASAAVLALALVLAATTIATADTVIFTNGDRLTGAIVKMEEGKLTIQSAVAGEVTVDLEQVATFETDEPAELHFTDGAVVHTRILPGSDGTFVMAETDTVAQREMDFASLAAINPPVKPTVVWSGSFTGGWSATHGNSFSETASLAYGITRRSEKHRTNLTGLYVVGRSEDGDTGEKYTSEESLLLTGKHNWYFYDGWYAYGSGRYKTDHVADLDYRIMAGGGLGYEWINTDHLRFATDAGYSHLCEQYTTHDETTKSDEASVQIGYELEWHINSWFSALHSTQYYPAFSSTSDYFLTTEAELRAKLTEKLFASFRAIMDYDSTPAEGAGATDTKYIAGVGWSF